MASDAELSVVASLVADVNDFLTKFQNDVPNAVQGGMTKAVAAVQDTSTQITNALNGAADEAANVGQRIGESFGAGLEDSAGEGGKNAGEASAEGMNEASEKHREAGEESGKSFGEGLMLIGAAVATAFLDKLHEMFNEASEMAEELKNTASETGDSIPNVQKLAYAFATVGVSGEMATRSIVLLQRKLEEAGQAGTGRSIFERVGLDPKAMANNPASENIALIADKMRDLSTAAERSDLAMAAFGRAGVKMIPILSAGGEELKNLEEEADKAGGVLGTDDVEGLDKLREKLNQLAVTSKNFYTSFLAPLSGAFTAIATAVQQAEAAFTHLTNDQRLVAVFAAVTGAAMLAEDGLKAFRPILGSLINKEVLDSLLEASSLITRIIPVVGILSLAWATNFGSMRTIVWELWNVVTSLWQRVSAAFSGIAESAKSVLGKSFSDLSAAVGQLLQDFVNFVATITSAPGSFDDLTSAASLLEKALKFVLDSLTSFAKWLDAAEPTIQSVAGAIRDHLNPALTTLGILILAMNARAIFTGWVGIIGAVTKAIEGLRLAFVALSMAEGIALALDPVTWFAIALAALAAVVYLVWTNWKYVVDSVTDAFEELKNFVSQLPWVEASLPVLDMLGKGWNAVAGAIGWAYDKLNAYNDKNNEVNAATKKAADEKQAALDKSSFGDSWGADSVTSNASPSAMPDSTQSLADAERQKRGQDELAEAERKRKEEEAKHTGSEHIAPVPKKEKKSTANTDALETLKDNLLPYQEAIRQTTLLLAQLGVAQQALGKIDTAAKVAVVQALYNKEIAATILLAQQERNEAAQDLRNKQAALALARAAKDTKERRKDIAEANTYQKDYDDAKLKATQEELKTLKFREEKRNAPLQLDASKAGNTELPAKVRLAAINDEIWRTMQQEVVSAGALENRTAAVAKLEQQKLDLLAAQATLQNNLTNSQDANVKANIAAQRSIREAKGENTGQQGAIANASDDVTTASIDSARAIHERQNAEDQLTLALKSHLVSDDFTIKKQTDLNTATAAVTTAQAALAVATIRLKQAQEATSQAVMTVRSGLLAMAQQVAGPIVDIVKNITAGMNPLVAIFMSLFQKSKAFNDIMNIMGAVIDRVAQIFDALRPVIDFLLGVLVGVVNVFLTMYNVIVMLLNVFGLHIEKIKLLNANLNNTNKAIPLLQITHDLPTMNELNSGKIADLKAKSSDIQNNMNTGFANGLSKIGEIAGTLIGIYALTKVIAAIAGGQGAAQGASSLLDQIKGLFGGKKSGYTGPDPNSGSFGSWGGSDSGYTGPGDTSSFGSWGSDTTSTGYTGPGDTGSFGSWGGSDSGGSSGLSGFGGILKSFLGSGSVGGASGSSGLSGILSGFLGGGSGSSGGLSSVLGMFGGNARSSSAGGTSGLSTQIADKLGGVVGTFLADHVGGGRSDANAGGQIGGQIGGMFGPVWGAVGTAVGEFIGSFLGPKKPTDNRNPDQTNAQINGEDYGQAIANLQGQTVNAGGKSYTNTTDILKQISDYIAGGGKGLSAALLKEFTGATGIVGGKNGILDLANGVNVQWQQLVNDANTAMKSITGAGSSMASSMQSLLGGATNVDLATLFGNGTAVTSAGGFNVASGGNSTLGNTTTPAPPPPANFTVHVGAIHGTDPGTVRAMFAPIMDEYGRQQQIVARTQASMVNRGNF